MADQQEHHEELLQENPNHHFEASTSGADAQIANLTRLVEELTQKYSSQQSQMENITNENQILKSQLLTLNNQAAYSYYYNPYAGYSSGANTGGWQATTVQHQAGPSTGGWQPATPYPPQGTGNVTRSPVAPMQPLVTPRSTSADGEREQPQRQTSQLGARQHTARIPRSTPERSPSMEHDVGRVTNVEDMMRNIVADEMRTLEAQMEQRFSSQIHRATTSTPGFDDLARGVRETPLSRRITNTATPKFSSISFPRFDGMSDPRDHLLQYKHVVQSTNIPTDLLDDMMCKLFAQSLKGAALRWFCNLPSESIDSFDELSLDFLKNYSVHLQSGKTTKDLWSVTQDPQESLRAYIKRFSRAISEISGLDDGTAREALKKGLKHRSLFKNELCARYPPTIQDALHRARGFIELEEENERTEQDLARTREETATARRDREGASRRERQSQAHRMDRRVERTTRDRQKRPLSPPKYSLNARPSEIVANLKKQNHAPWPRKQFEDEAYDRSKYYDGSKYCEFHKRHGHETANCRSLREEVAEMLKKGHLREYLTDKGKETMGQGDETRERRIIQEVETTPSPPPVRKTIGVICGGSTYSGETITAIKSHRRKATQPIASVLPDDPTEHSIVFHSAEATSLSRPHDDALVLTLNVSNCEVGRILVDNGSSADVLFLNTLKKMELSESDIERSTTILTGFNGESTTAIGKIKLPVYAAGVNKLTTFLVLDCPSAYNIILGRPWIHAMKAVPSTYHQCIRFPTKRGVREIKGNQEMARACYLNSIRARKADRL